jgi:hypothetical protein
MATDALPTHHSQRRRYHYRSNGTWQIMLAIILVPVWLLVLVSSVMEHFFCGFWDSDEECTGVGRGSVIRISLFAVAIIVLFVIGAVRRARSQPRPGPVAMALAVAAAALGVVALIVGVLTAVVAVAAANFVGLVVGTAAIATGVASLMNLPTDQSRGLQRAMAMGGAIAAVVAFLIAIYGGT